MCVISSTLHTPKLQKGEFSTWPTFKWAELNDISAALQSLSVGIHPLSPQLPRGMLTQHLAPSDQQQLHPLREKTQPVCKLHLCQLCYILTETLIHMEGNSLEHLSNNKINGMWWETLEGNTMVRDKSNASEWSTAMF